MSQVQTIGFGSGVMYATPSGGNQPSNPAPVPIGIIQNAKLTFGGDIKELIGQLQFPVDTAVGKRTVKGSFEYAQMTLTNWNNLMFGESAPATGGMTLAPNEAHSIPAASPYTVNVNNNTSPNLWTKDAGVIYSSSGFQLTPVTSSPTTGQYSVSAGVYTFAAADEGLAVQISYYYSTTTGENLTVLNHNMGWGPIVSLDLTMPYQGYDKNIFLPNVRIAKIDLTTKQDDYTMTSSDFSAFATPAGVVAIIYLPN